MGNQSLPILAKVADRHLVIIQLLNFVHSVSHSEEKCKKINEKKTPNIKRLVLILNEIPMCDVQMKLMSSASPAVAASRRDPAG